MNTWLILGLIVVVFLVGRYIFSRRKKEDDEVSDEVAKKAFEVIKGKTIGLYHNSHSQAASKIFYELRMMSQIQGVTISDRMSNVDAIVYISEEKGNQVIVTITAPMVDSEPAFDYKIKKVLPSSNPLNAVLVVYYKLAEFLQHK